MTKKTYLLPLLLFAFVFIACSETEEPGEYHNWRERNETFIDSLKQVFDSKTDSELKSITFAADKQYTIYYKVLKADENGRRPLFTDKVTCFYRGMLINEGVFGASQPPRYYTQLYKNLTVFDSNMSAADPTEIDSPAEFSVSGFYSGGVAAWTDILQNMKVGERWEVYIPWQIAYGLRGSGAIPGYSALIFDILLVSVVD